MKTQEEAEKCKCPLSLSAPGIAMPCIGAACMAWRWQHIIPGHIPRNPEQDKGFCGMVGWRDE